MIKAYDERVDFIAATSPAAVIGFRPSEATSNRVAVLIEQDKSQELSADEAAELERYMQLEHILRLAKARAREHVANG